MKMRPSILIFLLSTTLYYKLQDFPVAAQIVPDDTLGAERSVVTPNVNIREINSNRIDGGAVRGNNLFHSFREFSVGEGEGAYFSNPEGIENILSRVTGDNISQIFGTLGVLGNANLFFINPNGIVFGPNARLDVGGSFFATTADGILFKNGFEFTATNPQRPPLLTINIPLGLQFRGTEGNIVHRGDLNPNAERLATLGVQPGNTLALVGGDVELNGRFTLVAPGSQLELGGLTEAGTVEIKPINNTLRLQFPPGRERGNVSLRNGAAITSRSGSGGGGITINARNFNLLENSIIAAGIPSREGTLTTVGSRIEINATDQVWIENGSIGNLVSEGASGIGGDIVIRAGNVTVAGEGNEVIGTGLSSGAVGRGGNIEITAQSLTLTDDGTLLATTQGQGDSGKITVQVADQVTLSGRFGSGLLTNALSPESGRSGNIEITAGSVLVTNGAALSTQIEGRGDAGDIIIRSRDQVVFDGGDRINNSPSVASTGALGGNPLLGLEATGRAGNINITASSVSVTNGAQLITLSRTQRGAGDVVINATDSVSITGGGSILATGVKPANAGNVIIQAGGTVSVAGGGRSFSAGFFNQNLENSVPVDDNTPDTFATSFILTNVLENFLFPSTDTVSGQGGNIDITANSVSVRDGAILSTFSTTEGDAGDIRIRAMDSVIFDGSVSEISVNLEEGLRAIVPFLPADLTRSSGAFTVVVEIDLFGTSTGTGGDIDIQTGSLFVTNGAILAALTSGEGDAGNIRVNASELVEISSSDSMLVNSTGLLTSTEAGEAGKRWRNSDHNGYIAGGRWISFERQK